MRSITLASLAALATLSIAGCQTDDPATGTVQLNLVGTAPSGTAYRLREGNIMVQGPSTTTFWDTELDPGDTVLSENVPTGAYFAFLQDGWRLERLDSAGNGTPVDAELISFNPLDFTVDSGLRTLVPIRFRVGEGDIDLGQGYDIVIDVEEPSGQAEVCSTDADCATGQTCCSGGFLGTCQTLGAGEVCPLPDLTVDAQEALDSMFIQHRTFAKDSCALVEQCVDAPGDRRLLNFSTRTPNIGEVDMVLGDPTEVPGFEFSSCHSHYHFVGYARYQLLDAADAVVATGHKQAFCLLDLAPQPGTTTQPRYHCGFQGISAGWADIYGAGLDCQWVDITDVAAGDYRLRITINEDQTLPEADYTNNTIEVAVTIPADVPPIPGDPLSACPGTAGPQRDCGWEISAGQQAVACTPGANVSLGCGCTSGGTCANDPVLRVCDGDGACLAANALASIDDSCGLCPQAAFVCPASGTYTVLTGAFNANTAYTCEIAAAP